MSHCLCALGVEIRPFKNSPGVCPGGWSGLELTDTLITIDLLLKYVLALYAGVLGS